MNVDYLGLDLDDQEYLKGGQPCQNVDGATLPAQVEGVLHANLPAAPAQVGDDQPDERGVALVKQPRKVGAAPPWLQLQPDLERSRDGSDRGQGQRLEMAALHE